MTGRLGVRLVPVSAMALLLSVAVTAEAERPEQYRGMQANHGGLALLCLVVALGAAVGALVASRRGPRVRFAVVGAVCCALVVAAGWRGVTLAPMLDCFGYPKVAQQQDGSYRCAL
ncbi:hypothetical protein ACIRBX_20805 [Kitasatospora sp. NPDC096147]|uniref:hypothetical protein n=1 Tax=Kitasatospora sp. NPDC096147 TaxID=3364093 RepID=UPI0037F9C13A